MAYSEEALKAKLSTLSETQDSIVSVSQWITFHKRHADRIANYWLTRLRDAPPPKRLNYIYLVNDIVQNARARKRSEFPDAFAPLMPEAIQTAYRSSSPEVQNKIRRVVEVWKTRSVFESPIQSAIEARLDEIDKSKGSSGKKTLMGNSLFNSSSSAGIPKELESLAPLQIAVTKATLSARPGIDAAQAEYTKLNDPEVVLPSPPVHAARLSSLMKSLANAESSVSASIKARQSLIADLERILDINRAALTKDEETYLDLSSRRTSTEAKKREVEDSIMRGLATEEAEDMVEYDGGVGAVGESGMDVGAGSGDVGRSASASATPFDPARPDFEELTPEPEDHNDGDYDAQPFGSQPLSINPQLHNVLAGLSSSSIPNNNNNNATPNTPPVGGGVASRIRPASRSGSGIGIGIADHNPNGYSAKRQKTSHRGSDLTEEGVMPDFGEMGMDVADFVTVSGGHRGGTNDDLLQNLDDDVNDLIRQEGS